MRGAMVEGATAWRATPRSAIFPERLQVGTDVFLRRRIEPVEGFGSGCGPPG
jgi:hypothetical protein